MHSTSTSPKGWSRSIIMVCAMVTPCTTEGVTTVFAPRTSLYTTMGVEDWAHRSLIRSCSMKATPSSRIDS